MADSAIEVERLRKHQVQLEAMVEQLRAEIQENRERKLRADSLIRNLAGEKQKWLMCSRMLQGRYENIQGDVILASAFLTFLSGFSSEFRTRLVKSFSTLLTASGFKVSCAEPN